MTPIHHVTLTVSNLATTTEWYLKLFGDAQLIQREGAGWKRTRLNWPNGLVISFTQHEGTSNDETFSHSRIGLDHIGISCQDEAEVVSWFNKLKDLDFEHGPLEDVPYGWAVTSRDPDNIPIEFFCPK